VVAPATADLLAKAAAGIADDYLTTWLLAFPGPVLFAPAMNRHMWSHPAVQRNVRQLQADGARVLTPGYGPLGAVGEGEGWGRLPEPEAIADELARLFAGGGPARRRELPPPRPRTLTGRRVVVTAGPTREPLDPVRFFSNPSTGKMGFALAEAARDRGAEVLLVSGPVALPDPPGLTVRRVTTALEMYTAVLQALEATGGADVVVGAAAVADWRPAEVSAVKRKRGSEPLVVQLVPNPDILAEVRARGLGRVLVGFAAEAGAGPEEALRKLRAKGLDLIAFNDVRQPDAGFGADTNRVVLVDRHGQQEETGLVSKREVAERILDRVEALLGSGPGR
jgi:phosphopantothenoylcysteine decarboxylase/phosphopantothenate--cysteine ligase